MKAIRMFLGWPIESLGLFISVIAYGLSFVARRLVKVALIIEGEDLDDFYKQFPTPRR